MKISRKKRTELYAAIHEPIIRARIDIEARHPNLATDEKLFRLTDEIWIEVRKALSISDT